MYMDTEGGREGMGIEVAPLRCAAPLSKGSASQMEWNGKGIII